MFRSSGVLFLVVKKDTKLERLAFWLAVLNPAGGGTHLTYIACPRWLFLSGWSDKDDVVRLALFRLHYDLKVQVLWVLAAPLPFGCKPQSQQPSFIQKETRRHSHMTKSWIINIYTEILFFIVVFLVFFIVFCMFQLCTSQLHLICLFSSHAPHHSNQQD